jgi:ABC-2 type transport system permease protein
VWGIASLGLGFFAWQITVSGHLKTVSYLLWPVLVLWQVIPILLSSFQEGVDLSLLLRFPVSFRSYALLYLFFGLFDLSSLMGALALMAIWLGIAIAQPHLLVVATAALAVFGMFNLLLTRMIFAWIDKWLARRRTREILSFVLLFGFVGLQLLNPAFHIFGAGHGSSLRLAGILQVVERVQQYLPPGLAGWSIEAASQGNGLAAAGELAGLAVYGFVVGGLLNIRLQAEYRGENLGEAPSAVAPAARRKYSDAVTAPAQRLRRGSAGKFELVRGVLWKELIYLARSGVMLFSLVAPLMLVFIAGGPGLADNPLARQFALPIGVVYCFLPLTRQVCNSFGGEGTGIQLYFLSPAPIRMVMLAKNLLQVGLFGLEVLLATSIILYRVGRPPLDTVLLTLSWLAFALPLELAAGNVLSLTMAYRMTLTRLSREQGATGNGLLALLVQLVVFGVGAGVYFMLAHFDRVGLAPVVLLLLAVGSVFAWLRVMASVDGLANRRRESLIATLARAG